MLFAKYHHRLAILLLASTLFSQLAVAQQTPPLDFTPSIREASLNDSCVTGSSLHAEGPKHIWTSNRFLLDEPSGSASGLSGSAEVGAIFLSRSSAGSQTIAVDQNGESLLNAGDMESEMGGGLLFKFAILNMTPARPYDLQFEMFSIDEIASRSVVNADEVINVFFNSVPVTPQPSQTFDYISDLQNYELNWRLRYHERVRLLAGLRYMRVDERFDSFNSIAIQNRIGSFSNATNDMLGGQIGAEATLWKNDFWSLFGSIKYAFLHNSVEGGASASDPTGDPLSLEYDGETSSRLWDFELGAYTTITEQVGLKIGYRGLVAEDIAAGPDQNAAFDIFTGGGSVAFSDAEWHGLFVTLEAVW